jgi:hypothetical protein
MLVTWSGGLDSTYGLVRMLKETEDDVHVHHIHRFSPHDDRGTPAQSAIYEAAAVSKMLPIIRGRYRHFTYSESLVDNTVFPHFAPDAATVLLFAGCVAKRLGLGPDDRILDIMNSDEDMDWQPGSIAGQFLRMNSLHILKLIYRSETIPQLYTYDGIPTKRQEVDYLSADLVAMNASCRAPVLVNGVWQTCGTCRKCRSFAAMGLQRSVKTAPSSPEEGADKVKTGRPKRIVERRPEGALKRLVLWSGGEASTRVLERVLAETSDPVHAHHIRCSSRLDRQADDLSLGGHDWVVASRTLEQLKRRYRPFNVTISTIGPERVIGHTHPINVVAYCAAQAAKSWLMQPVDQIVVGAWGDSAAPGSDREALYGSGSALAPQMLKAIMRSEDGPRIILG